MRKLRQRNRLVRSDFTTIFKSACALIVFWCVFAGEPSVAASGENSRRYRIGAFLGFGGSGVTQVVNVNDAPTIVERSEGPAVISFFADRLISDFFSLGVEHSRGVNFAPFSMGSSFTGITGRWYFLGVAASVGEANEENAILLIQRFSPYVGGAVGAAAASIRRENDLVPNIEGSGLYFGFRLGADYPLSPGLAIRPEFFYSTTIFQSATLSSSLAEYSIGCGILWMF